MSEDSSRRSRYSETFKNETVSRFRKSGLAVSVFARQVGIEQSVLHRWIKRRAVGAAAEGSGDDAGEYARSDDVLALRCEVNALRRSVETLRTIIEKTLINRCLAEITSGNGSRPRMQRAV